MGRTANDLPSRRWGGRVGTAFAFALAVFALGLWTSLSAASGGTASATTTKTFTSTGAQQSFTVPDGVTKIHVTAVGAHGGHGAGTGAPDGGSGAVASADLPVTPGQVLFVEVGANALDSTGASAPPSLPFGGGGLGGRGQAAGGGAGGSGGGASDVRTISRSDPSTLFSRLITAGGGGGGAGVGQSGSSDPPRGGSAGNSGLGGSGDRGSDGYGFGTGTSGVGGGGGMSTAGGSGGTAPDPASGFAGSLGGGGDGGDSFSGPNGGGGGGGGGLFGGGGGSAGTTTSGGPTDLHTGGGGGGGSSGFGPTATMLSLQTDTTRVPRVAISYSSGGGNKSGLKFGKVKLNKKKGTATLPVTVPGTGTLSIGGKGLVKKRPALARAIGILAKKITEAGTYKLKVKTKGRKKSKLFSTGKVKVKAVVTFKPTSGDAVKDSKRIRLKKN